MRTSIDVHRWLRQSTGVDTVAAVRSNFVDGGRDGDRRAAGRGDRCGTERARRGGTPAEPRSERRSYWRRARRRGHRCREWHHVRLFSRWGELVDPAAEKLLAPTGWHGAGRGPLPDRRGLGRALPAAARPTRSGDRVRFGARVVGVARRGRDRVVDTDRDIEPLTVHVTTAGGEERITARAVMDASGTWAQPNPLGGDGLPALGRAGRRRPDRVPGTRPRRPGRPRPVRGQAHRRRRCRALRPDGTDRLRRSRRACSGHAGRLAAPPRIDRQHLRRR